MSDRFRVGQVIRYSSGGTIHTGRITEVGEHSHVKVDSSPLTIPPNWILDDAPSSDPPSAYLCEACGRLSHDPSGNCEHDAPVALYRAEDYPDE